MHFVDREHVRKVFVGRSVALVGSGPGSLENDRGFIDAHDVVVRVNNYKLLGSAGNRTDVHYSFYGSSIRKTSAELVRDGVKLCICKCPDAQFMESAWHRERGKMAGVDFRYIYELRAAWWFGPTYVPTVEEFIATFWLLGGHVPTTGFAALLEVLRHGPASVYMTGFDFFLSATHNVNERWHPANPTDPIGHVPDAERAWLKMHIQDLPITVDRALAAALQAPPTSPQPSLWVPPRQRVTRQRVTRFGRRVAS